MATWASELLGEELETKEGKKTTLEVLDGKSIVVLFFSASWCLPCLSFSPLLVEAYNAYDGNDVAIVFIPQERGQEGYDSAYSLMPWAALPFGNSALCASISKKYGVKGIPTVLVLSPDGKVLKENGRDDIQTLKDLRKSVEKWTATAKERSEGTAGSLAWAVDLLGPTLLTKEGEKPTTQVLDFKKVVLIYFTAHWCPPCRGFTPILSNAYRDYQRDDVEVVFVSRDKNQESFNTYYREMPWVALPFVERSLSGKLSQKYHVQGIPTLVVLDGQSGKMLRANARNNVQTTKDLAKCVGQWVQGPCCCVL
mmetsp:Transcript_60136/g.130423  ORF Transcript_60136/g.130423 Transcript_60136/m.130423 type:complete len:310 (-) Transcript_60136:116-1045(-)